MSTIVLVIGAAGYIGQAIALAFRKSGYKVYGLVRNEEKAKVLRQNEIHVIIGDILSDSYQEVLKVASIIIDAVGVGDLGAKLLDKLEVFSKEKYHKPLFIFTSGLLTHGDNPYVVDETHEPNALKLENRIAFEKRVVLLKDIRGVVIRPGYVYGGSGGFFGDAYFNFKENDELKIYGRLDKKWSWVHVDDLANAYVRVAKAGHVVDREVFDIAGPWAPTSEEVIVAFAKAAGWKGKIVHIAEAPDNSFEQITDVNVILNSEKAFNLFGWRETHLGPINEIDTYFMSWKFSKQKN